MGIEKLNVFLKKKRIRFRIYMSLKKYSKELNDWIENKIEDLKVKTLKKMEKNR